MSNFHLIEGELKAAGFKFGVVMSRFNEFVNSKLLDGALDYLKRAGANEGDITVVKVPGAFELPMAVKKLIDTKKFDAVICLGTLIRGETNHFDLLSSQVTKMLSELSVSSSIPVSYGIITAESIEQAISRAGTKMGNKGFDAAMSAVEMASLYSRIKKA
ncbi:MAG: 6,7-dimethyl-8-ribityllumazine synthase [Deltaproteobacteria bacterium]|jgi:6,7-dimethyl-8-ribityllumazine synthase|nr:6,7-dimethyl-8-ribityllumazine synthase [Deltaproteobacteria bacterium]MCL5880472.1 6,7-dimethyl-8-ribityllumazine synthase [Deltaproteobacteria bacterium]MDA8304653.1 6,7-dimethyl-8-ribityllumazine synthase [Deltaproteobacteria bacterium]